MPASRLLRLTPLALVPLGAVAWALLARADEPPAPAPVPPAPAPAPAGVVHVRRPDGPPRVDTGRVDRRGAPVLASCGTCHATRAPDPSLRTAPDIRWALENKRVWALKEELGTRPRFFYFFDK